MKEILFHFIYAWNHHVEKNFVHVSWVVSFIQLVSIGFSGIYVNEILNRIFGFIEGSYLLAVFKNAAYIIPGIVCTWILIMLIIHITIVYDPKVAILFFFFVFFFFSFAQDIVQFFPWILNTFRHIVSFFYRFLTFPALSILFSTIDCPDGLLRVDSDVKCLFITFYHFLRSNFFSCFFSSKSMHLSVTIIS
jgi:hypothetical protein